MEKLLVVEDSQSAAQAVTQRIRTELGYHFEVAHDFAQAQALVEDHGDDFFCALLDLHLPDAAHGEVVDYMVARGVPSIVFTSLFDPQVHKAMMAKPIVDYVIKGAQFMDHLMRLIRRVNKNARTKVLIVDDSPAFRGYVRKVLTRQRLNVLEAADGVEALDLVEEHQDLKLVLTDYNMPRMDGLELTQSIRGRLRHDELAIIAISTVDDKETPAQFLKVGANDYLHKSASPEEIKVRVAMNLDVLDLIEETMNLANRDGLTGCYNRRYFFEQGDKLFARSVKDGSFLVAVMVDIDHFKKINDSYGHPVGDVAIRQLATMLRRTFKGKGLVARIGGEEFCVLGTSMDPGGLSWDLELMRQEVEDNVIEAEGHSFGYTISCGAAVYDGKQSYASLAAMLQAADQELYRAKEGGRNQVRIAR